MCCFKRPKRIQRKYKKRSVIVHPEPDFKPKRVVYPEEFNLNPKKRRNAVDGEFIEKFVKEVINCGGCGESFDLGSNELKIHCNLCNQFFHCKIAGKCQGDNCKITVGNKTIHQASYCYDCVGLLSDDKLLCKECFK
jgi:hypothetical protein